MNRINQTLASMSSFAQNQPKFGQIQIKTNTPTQSYMDKLESRFGYINGLSQEALSKAKALDVDTLKLEKDLKPTLPAPADANPVKGINSKLSAIADPILEKYDLKVTSGYRPDSKLKTSQHTHGNAYDVGWSHLDTQQRRAVVQDFKDAGITGFGVGNNILHVDIGPKRHWTYDNSGKWISGMKQDFADLFK